MLAQHVNIYEKPQVNTISLEAYIESVLWWESPQMVGHIIMPKFIGKSNRITGVCCTEDETPYRYEIDTQTAKLIRLNEV